MRTFTIYILAFLVAITGWRCGDDIDTFIPDPELKGDIDVFFAAAREDISVTTSINIDFPTAVVTPRKTVLIFQPKSLIDFQGNIVKGVVEIEILELLTKGEILLYGIPTNSREKLLSSGGEFYIKANQNGTPLRLREGMPVRILTDLKGTAPEERMELFYGFPDSNNVDEDTYTWEEADNNPDTWENVDVTEWVALADSQQIIEGFGYESFSNRLDWINFDVFVNIPAQNRTDVCVTLPEEFGKVNTAVFLVFNERHSIIALPNNPELDQFCSYYGTAQLSVPVGEQVTFVVISEQGNGFYYFALIDAELSRDFEISILPEAVPLEEIKESIENL